jgi:hypothetical protein
MIYLLFAFLERKKQHLVDESILEAAMFTHGMGVVGSILWMDMFFVRAMFSLR